MHACVQSLDAEERSFACQLHDQEVSLFCHDVMQLSQLQREIARKFGHSPACVVVVR